MVSTSWIISTFAFPGIEGHTGDGAIATLNVPLGIAVDATGNIYVADTFNNKIRMVSTTGIISNVAGTGAQGYSGDGANATAAELNAPYGVTVDATGNVYIADSYNNRIRMVSTTGIISTVAGTRAQGYSGDGANATAAALFFPIDVTVDATGNIYITDFVNNRIRMVSTSGIISTFAGTGLPGYSGDGGGATAAGLYHTAGVAINKAGNIYIADSDDHM